MLHGIESAVRDGCGDCEPRTCGGCANAVPDSGCGCFYCELELDEWLERHYCATPREAVEWVMGNLHGEREASCPRWREYE